jgi:hypothetical protein
LPCLSMPIRWKLFLPRSMPMVVTRSCRVLLVMGVVSAAFVFPAFPYPAGNTAGPCHYGAFVGMPVRFAAVACPSDPARGRRALERLAQELIAELKGFELRGDKVSETTNEAGDEEEEAAA